MRIAHKILTGIIALLCSAGVMAEENTEWRMAEDGNLMLESSSGKIIAGDVLMVLEGRNCIYYLPETEAPPFATLLYPTGGEKERENALDITKEENAISCEGRKENVIRFIKTATLKNGTAVLNLKWTLSKKPAEFEYVLMIPAEKAAKTDDDNFKISIGGSDFTFSIKAEGIKASLEEGTHNGSHMYFLHLRSTNASSIELSVQEKGK